MYRYSRTNFGDLVCQIRAGMNIQVGQAFSPELVIEPGELCK